MTVLYIILTLIFIWTQVYMPRVIWRRGNEITTWKKSYEYSEGQQTAWYQKHNKVVDEFAPYRHKDYEIKSSRYRLAAAIVKRRILPSIKKEAQEITLGL